MKFFVPFAEDDAHADAIWAASRAGLLDRGLPTTGRRIWALDFHPARPDLQLHIGRKMPDDYGPALLILEASDIDLFYICTPFNGILSGDPFALVLPWPGRAIGFDEVVEGRA